MSANSELRKFVAPEFIFGAGSRRLAGQYARNMGGRRVLVVTDRGVLAAGWTDQVTENLEAAGLAFTLYSGITPNPRTEEVAAGAELFAAKGCNLLVAVGGGSVIDCTKGIGIVSSSRRPIQEFQGVDKVEHPIPPLICVPTTGGSSADVSQFAIITDLRERTKFAIISKAVVPDLSLIDPETLLTTDPYLTACTGLDALTHAIEAFVSSASSPMTDLHALQAIHLLARHLLPSINNPGDLELRIQIMLGSLHAGLAFSNAILGATHAMAHSLGGLLDLPHGECNAILLDRIVEFNFPAAPERFRQIGETLGLDLRGLTMAHCKTAAARKIRELRRQAGLIRQLGALGVQREQIPQLSRMAMADPCMVTNPRRPKRRDIEVLYAEAL